MEFINCKKIYSIHEGRNVIYKDADYRTVERVYNDLKKTNPNIYIWEV
jgi:hypothetical protein